MACNIGGATVHSWGAVSFKDKRGVTIRPQDQTYSAEIPAMSTKCGALRFLFIDEIEATGADTIGEVEHNVTFHISSKNVFKYKKNGDVRPFGGVNTLLLGDFWQLRPTGQIAIMSNPFSVVSQESAKAKFVMAMFWDEGVSWSLQPWTNNSRMLHLDSNERSGADKWFAKVLVTCREGNMSEDDYNFLHGYPTAASIDSWYHRNDDPQWTHDSQACQYNPYCIRQHWQHWSPERARNFECLDCWQERKRRARVIDVSNDAAQAKKTLTDPAFANAILVTQYNVAVFSFAQHRALNFAHASNAQSFWIQATDSPPNCCLLYTSPSPRD